MHMSHQCAVAIVLEYRPSWFAPSRQEKHNQGGMLRHDYSHAVSQVRVLIEETENCKTNPPPKKKHCMESTRKTTRNERW